MFEVFEALGPFSSRLPLQYLDLGKFNNILKLSDNKNANTNLLNAQNKNYLALIHENTKQYDLFEETIAELIRLEFDFLKESGISQMGSASLRFITNLMSLIQNSSQSDPKLPSLVSYATSLIRLALKGTRES